MRSSSRCLSPYASLARSLNISFADTLCVLFFYCSALTYIFQEPVKITVSLSEEYDQFTVPVIRANTWSVYQSERSEYMPVVSDGHLELMSNELMHHSIPIPFNSAAATTLEWKLASKILPSHSYHSWGHSTTLTLGNGPHYLRKLKNGSSTISKVPPFQSGHGREMLSGWRLLVHIRCSRVEGGHFGIQGFLWKEHSYTSGSLVMMKTVSCPTVMVLPILAMIALLITLYPTARSLFLTFGIPLPDTPRCFILFL